MTKGVTSKNDMSDQIAGGGKTSGKPSPMRFFRFFLFFILLSGFFCW